MPIITGYIATYTSLSSKGIYRFTFDDVQGMMSEPELIFEAVDPKYVSIRDGLLSAPLMKSGKAGICLLNVSGKTPELLDEIFLETATACFVCQDQDYIYTANFHEGLVMIYRKERGKLSLEKRIETAVKSGCHQILFHRGRMLVPCMEQDVIRIYDRDRGFAAAGLIPFPEGSGPRHGVFDEDGSWFYAATQHSNQLFVYRAETDGNFHLNQVIPVLPEGVSYDEGSAAVRISSDNKYLYLSTRGADMLTVFRLGEGRAEIIQQVFCGGAHPRDFVITPDGGWLIVANRDSGDLTVFRRSKEEGLIREMRAKTPAIQAVGIAFLGDSR